MKPRLRSWLAFVLALAVLSGVAGAVDVGLQVRPDCTTLNPVGGQTLCFESTTGILKVWTGNAWVPVAVNSLTVKGLGPGTILMGASPNSVGVLGAPPPGTVLSSGGFFLPPVWSTAPTVTGLTVTGVGPSSLLFTDGFNALTTIPSFGPLATGDIMYFTASKTWTRLAIGTAGQALVVASGLPSWGAGGAGAYYTWGNVSKNNATTPNTQFDLTADVVQVWNPTTFAVNIIKAPGTITNNVSTAGPAVNGRDQAGAFSASSWVHFYWIYNGTTINTVSSATAPPTGPTLPTGYTQWAYAAAVRFNGSSVLPKIRFVGPWGYLESPILALNAGVATTETAVSTAVSVPPNAQSVLLRMNLIASTTASTAVTATYRFITAVDYYLFTLSTNAAADAQTLNTSVTIPNIGQNFYYLLNTATGSPSTTIFVLGYSVPTGE